MKKLQTLLLLAVLLPTFLACSAKSAENKESSETKDASVSKQINVYYFHFTRRCVTCTTVESKTLEILKEVYATEMEDKLITFQAVNLDEPSSNELAEKLGISGQTLLLTNGKEKIDITSDGFMYAKSNPEKLKEIIKTKINELMI
jgi:hypothetical protein